MIPRRTPAIIAILFLGAAGLPFVPGSVAAPAREGDPVLIGTKWKGKLTQRGTFAGGGKGPPELDVVLIVTKRDDSTFAADLQESTTSLKITYLVKGEIARTADGKSYTVKFESFDSKDIESTTAIIGIPYTATLTGKIMKGTWKMTQGEADLQGDFEVELSK